MKKFSMLLLTAMFIVVTACASRQTAGTNTETNDKPNALAISSAVLKGTVQSIDYKTRMIVVKTDSGQTISKRVENDVKNIEQIKKGDVIVAQFVESVAVDIRTPESGAKKPDISEYSYVEAKTDQKNPYKLKARVIEARAVVTEIDYAKRFVTIKGPDGNKQSFLVDKSVANFKNIKKNDVIIVTYTESVTFTIEKAVK